MTAICKLTFQFGFVFVPCRVVLGGDCRSEARQASVGCLWGGHFDRLLEEKIGNSPTAHGASSSKMSALGSSWKGDHRNAAKPRRDLWGRKYPEDDLAFQCLSRNSTSSYLWESGEEWQGRYRQ